MKKLVKGSIADLLEREKWTIANALDHVQQVFMVDISSSMSIRDGENGRSRYDEAQSSLELLQAKYPGACLVYSFNTQCLVHLNGAVPPPHGETSYMSALEAVKGFDGLIQGFWLISDGKPNVQIKESMELAATFTTPIKGVFVGNPNDHESLDTLNSFCALTGGNAVRSNSPGSFVKEVILMLEDKNG